MRGLATSIVVCVLLAHAQVATAQSSGGPDSFGYIFQGTPFDFVALSGIGLATPLAVGDDGVADVTLPWPFLFYGSPHSSVRVGANGGLTFGSPGAVGFANKELPDGLPDSPDIAVFWDDLNPSAGGAVYKAIHVPSLRVVAMKVMRVYEHEQRREGRTAGFESRHPPPC